MTGFFTVKSPASNEIVIKKSVFITNISPVCTEDKAREFINNIRLKYNDATHNVFAYIIGHPGQVMRFNDDGEPSGTAGLPVLEVLKKHGLTNLAVVVTRYFGGILLGTGGLVRAYTEAVKSIIEAAGVTEMSPHILVKINTGYSCHELIKTIIDRNKGQIHGTDYSDRVVINVYIPEIYLKCFLEEAVVLNEVFVKTGKTNYLPTI